MIPIIGCKRLRVERRRVFGRTRRPPGLRAWPPLGTRETASRAPDCAAFLRRTIPISASPEAESRVQSVLLDAVSMAPESAFLESVTPAIQAVAALVAGAPAGRGSIRNEREPPERSDADVGNEDVGASIEHRWSRGTHHAVDLPRRLEAIGGANAFGRQRGQVSAMRFPRFERRHDRQSRRAPRSFAGRRRRQTPQGNRMVVRFSPRTNRSRSPTFHNCVRCDVPASSIGGQSSAPTGSAPNFARNGSCSHASSTT